ncbi:MAG: hypothetical protein AAF399_18895 [Bacteroidota bacterium]
MNRFLRIFLILGGMLGSLTSLSAQSFFNYQTIGVHTWYVSLGWNGQAPTFGVGYNLRNTNRFGFTDIGAELRSPITALYDLNQQELIVGAYGPFRLRSRQFIGGGLHARINRYLNNGAQHTRLTFAPSLLPTYTLAAPLDDRPYATISARATYLLVLADKAKTGETVWLPGHGTEVGGNLALHLERTLGISFNGFATRHWSFKTEALPATDTQWRGGGDLNFGTTYYLRRR